LDRDEYLHFHHYGFADGITDGDVDADEYAPAAG
jgi:hypothetical protein